MKPNHLCVGDQVLSSPAGGGTFTGVDAQGWPCVDGIAVGWLVRIDGREYNPRGIGARVGELELDELIVVRYTPAQPLKVEDTKAPTQFKFMEETIVDESSELKALNDASAAALEAMESRVVAHVQTEVSDSPVPGMSREDFEANYLGPFAVDVAALLPAAAAEPAAEAPAAKAPVTTRNRLHAKGS